MRKKKHGTSLESQDMNFTRGEKSKCISNWSGIVSCLVAMKRDNKILLKIVKNWNSQLLFTAQQMVFKNAIAISFLFLLWLFGLVLCFSVFCKLLPIFGNTKLEWLCIRRSVSISEDAYSWHWLTTCRHASIIIYFSKFCFLTFSRSCQNKY